MSYLLAVLIAGGAIALAYFADEYRLMRRRVNGPYSKAALKAAKRAYDDAVDHGHEWEAAFQAGVETLLRKN